MAWLIFLSVFIGIRTNVIVSYLLLMHNNTPGAHCMVARAPVTIKGQNECRVRLDVLYIDNLKMRVDNLEMNIVEEVWARNGWINFFPNFSRNNYVIWKLCLLWGRKLIKFRKKRARNKIFSFDQATQNKSKYLQYL